MGGGVLQWKILWGHTIENGIVLGGAE